MEKAAALQARTGERVIHLEVGQPNFSAPQLAVETASRDVHEQRNQAYIPNG